VHCYINISLHFNRGKNIATQRLVCGLKLRGNGQLLTGTQLVHSPLLAETRERLCALIDLIDDASESGREEIRTTRLI